jgi:hypothetical protein
MHFTKDPNKAFLQARRKGKTYVGHSGARRSVHRPPPLNVPIQKSQMQGTQTSHSEKLRGKLCALCTAKRKSGCGGVDFAGRAVFLLSPFFFFRIRLRIKRTCLFARSDSEFCKLFLLARSGIFLSCFVWGEAVELSWSSESPWNSLLGSPPSLSSLAKRAIQFKNCIW